MAPALRGWLERTVAAEASDLHLIVGHPPVLRVHGDLSELDAPALEAEELEPILRALCPPSARLLLDSARHADFSFDCALPAGAGRFRANLFYSGGRLAACLRAVPADIPGFDWAGFPVATAERLAFLPDGLVIVTGVTGSGKTTTLAMLVNLIHETGGHRIITVEDPIEYRFPRATHSVLTQRELGQDVLSFAEGLKSGLRQDPDVILVGEIRDRETAQMALSAAETGHLVFTTLHTRDAKGAITRYADLFPQDAQSDIRSQLAMSLRAVVSQRLLPALEPGTRRQLALEVLWNTFPIASAIRQGKLESLDNYLLTHRDDGLLSFDESVRQLMRAGRITLETARRNMRDPTLLQR